ncbi:MAG: GAF domain-containing protein [Anaerolineae bacterium]|nr:GAF domain-containing protein [Anaerolineae bacterium]
MKILMVASEAAPYLQTGDVANVVTGLAKELHRQGHDVRIVIPYYRNLVQLSESQTIIEDLTVPLGVYGSRLARVCQTHYIFDTLHQLPFYFIENAYYFGRDRTYGYLDDYERFVFFTRAVLEMLHTTSFTAEPWQPDIIHGHDWISGLIPMWLRLTLSDKFATRPAFLYTLHNANLQGVFNHRAINIAEMVDSGIYTDLGETTNRINFMLRGLLAADVVNTVSPTHAQEIMTGNYATSLSRTIQVCQLQIAGVLNGLDDNEYDPSFDSNITVPFGPTRLNQRIENKQALQKRLGLNINPESPLLAIVSRLISDKGTGLLEAILPQLMQDDELQLIAMGTIGDYRYWEAFTKFEREYPGRVKTIFFRDDGLYRQVFSGIDIILVPSLHEPCGLQQLMGMHYGAIPVVRQTGGLADTIVSWDIETSKGKGFLFTTFEPESLLQAIQKAVETYQSSRMQWHRVQQHNMLIDVSWRTAASEYIQLYQRALDNSRKQSELRIGQSKLSDDPNDLLVSTILEANDLAMATDINDYLKHIARGTRELLKSDAVLIWLRDEAMPQRFQIGAYSLWPPGQSSQAEITSHYIHFEQRDLFWRNVFRREEKDPILQARLGFLDSELARIFKWQVQLSVPINTHGNVLGQIDIFSSKIDYYFPDWDINAASALANTIAISLERIRLNNQATNLLAVDREMAQAQSVNQLTTSLLYRAKELTHADSAYISLEGGPLYSIDNQGQLLINLDGESLTSNKDEHFIGADLKGSANQKIGRLEVSKRQVQTFSRDDETTLAYLARQAANALQTVYLKEKRDQDRVAQLSLLAASLVGGLDFDQLLEQVVKTTANVLRAQAASLYLVNEEDPEQKMFIRAAAGYHELLLKQGASYRIGEGTTGWIAQTGETFKADSLQELHEKSPWHGKHMSLQKGREPNAFLGIPLKIMDRTSGKEQIIGVLKLEDRDEKLPPDQPTFSDEDMRLGEMMANTIATVVYNIQLSEKRLQALSHNLGKLSSTLTGGQDRQSLMNNIVNTIMAVLRVAAASLYLVDMDDPEKRLVIRAAGGYHEPLLKQGASYRIGEGTTGWIAQTAETFKADSLQELHDNTPWQGKHMFLQDGREPNAFLGIPLKVMDRISGKEQVIGVLKLEDRDENLPPDQSVFSDEDMRLGEMMASIIATVVYNTQLSEERLQEFSSNLTELSGALVASQDRRTLMDNIVKTIKNVLKVDAVSLYLVNEKLDRLVIEAASGYQESLVEAGASYGWGEGVTGRIAETNQPFRANSIDELRQQGRSVEGKYDDLHQLEEWVEHASSAKKQLRPTSFYGLPLRVQGRDKPIGVLKAESIRERPFTDEDVLLIEIMGNVIATVVYNTQLSEVRLREFSNTLGKLSGALAGSRDRQTLMVTIVNTIKDVLKVDAVSLYLADDKNEILTIQAASGYQEPLVKAGASYKWGEGVTGRIARTNEPFGANSTETLRQQGGSQRGKYDHLQNDIRPKSFYGFPLRVQGRSKPIGVLKAESIRERPFTNEDKLLIEMMGNVISTVVYNAQLNQSKLNNIVKILGTPQQPRPESAQELLSQFACSDDHDTLELMAASLATVIGVDADRAYSEALTLLEIQANPELFNHIAGKSSAPYIQRRYGLFYQATRTDKVNQDKLKDIFKISHLWINLEETGLDDESFQTTVIAFMHALSQTCNAEFGEPITYKNWVGVLVDTSHTFENTALPSKLPFVFHRQGSPQSDDLDALRELLDKSYNDLKYVALPMWGEEQIVERADNLLQNKLKQPFAIDAVTLDIVNIQKIAAAPRPDIELQRAVLSQISLIKVSPYQIVGPVNQRVFFGRERELRKISDGIASASFAVIAGRRVGKTSILRQLQYVRLSNTDFQIDYYDCASKDMYLELPVILKSLKDDHPTVLLLDEADKLVPIDQNNNWALFNTMRGYINSGYVQVVLGGELTLREALRNAKSPLFNLTNEILLGPLDYRSVEELVTKPMRQMEIELVDESGIIKHIYDVTSGHPNIVQRICRRLIERLNDEHRRKIMLKDVKVVIEDPGFQREDFLTTYWDSAEVLEKIISLLMAEDQRLRTLGEIHKALHQRCERKPKIGEVDKALQSLVDLRSILKQTPDGYEFAVSAFPRVVAGTMTLTDMLAVFIEQYSEGQTNEI